MKKDAKNLLTKNPLMTALVLVSIICIVFALTAALLSSQLKAEKLNTGKLGKQITDLQRDFDVMMSEQANIIEDLQNSLDITREEAQESRSGSEAE